MKESVDTIMLREMLKVTEFEIRKVGYEGGQVLFSIRKRGIKSGVHWYTRRVKHKMRVTARNKKSRKIKRRK